MGDSQFTLESPEILATRAAHLCVDVQNLFAENTEWKVRWLARTLPNICRITSAYSKETIFTRFIPAAHPGEGQGAWKPYYMRWAHMTRQNLHPELLDIVPELAALAPQAEIIDKPAYGPWLCTGLHYLLKERRVDTLIITGLETEICILATVSGAVDLGYRIILIRDAVCSSADETHDNILKVYRQRYNMQIEIIETEEFLRRGGRL